MRYGPDHGVLPWAGMSRLFQVNLHPRELKPASIHVNRQFYENRNESDQI